MRAPASLSLILAAGTVLAAAQTYRVGAVFFESAEGGNPALRAEAVQHLSKMTPRQASGLVTLDEQGRILDAQSLGGPTFEF